MKTNRPKGKLCSIFFPKKVLQVLKPGWKCMFSSPRALSVASHLSDEDKEGEEEDVPCHGQPMRIEHGGRCLVPLKSTHPHHHRPPSPSIFTIIAIFTTNKTIRICSPWAKRAWASSVGSCWRRAGSGRSDSRSDPESASRSRSGCPCCLRTNISLCKWSCLFLETSQGDLNIIFWGTKTSRHWCIIVKSPVGKLCYAHSCKGLGAADEGLASGGNLQ